MFVTCLVDSIFSDVGKATVRLLERLGHQVEFPSAQTCCGQMHTNTGYRNDALPLIRHHVDVFTPYEVIVAMAAPAWATATPGRWGRAQRLSRVARLFSRRGRIKTLPFPLSRWSDSRDAPAPAAQSFRDWWGDREPDRP